MRVLFLSALMMFVSGPVLANELAGVPLVDQITQEGGTTLQLNGAGIRYKFVIKVYAAMLYLEHKSSDAAAVIGDSGSKQMIMHFLYKEVGKDALVEAWNEGFNANGSPEQLTALKAEIEQFNSFFETVKKGDRIILDYIPGTGTVVTVAGQQKGTIPGKDFNDLLLSIWLGKKPITEKLRDSLLGK